MNSIQGVSLYALRKGLGEVGIKDGDFFYTSKLLDSNSLLLTANADTVYFWGNLDLSKGPLVVETPPMVLGIFDDFWFRWALIIYLVIATSVSFYIGRLDEAPWVGAKLLVFAALVFCGLMIRIYIPGYIAGIIALRKQVDQPTLSDDINKSMTKSLDTCRPFVLAIWVGLLIECYLGVAKPGGSVPVTAVLGF